MTVSLYDLSVGTYLQILEATAGVLARGESWAAENGVDLAGLVETRLHDDMWTFRDQVISTAHHSAGTVAAMKAGKFAPPVRTALDYKGLQGLIATSIESLKGESADAINALAANEIIFDLGGNKIPFTVPNFVLSFSLPNFYFHATTAYDILRMKGVPLGKRNFMGKMRTKLG